MRRLLAAGLLALAACHPPDANTLAPSSLAACDFEHACAAPERCDISQLCGGPMFDAGPQCDPEQGDRRCHQPCAPDGGCSEAEVCRAVGVTRRSDVVESARLCFTR